jgi:hypothetical protein
VVSGSCKFPKVSNPREDPKCLHQGNASEDWLLFESPTVWKNRGVKIFLVEHSRRSEG